MLKRTPGLLKVTIIFIVFLFLGSSIVIVPSLANASPPGNTVLYSTPITLTNSQGTPTVSGFDQLLNVTWNDYSAYLNSNVSNVRFYSSSTFTTVNELSAWMQNNNTPTALKSNVWVNLGNNIVPATGSLTIYMTFLNKNASWNSTYWGVAPQLSPSYGQFDNGASVFPFYDNFKGNTLSPKWYSYAYSPGTISVSNGLDISTQGSPDEFIASSTQWSTPVTAQIIVSSASGVYPNVGLYNTASDKGYALTLNGNTIPIGDTSGNSTSYYAVNFLSNNQISSSNVPGAWGLDWLPGGTEIGYWTGAQHKISNSASPFGSQAVYIGLLAASSSGSYLDLYSAQVYYSAPNGVMPSASFGTTTNNAVNVIFTESGLPSGSLWYVDLSNGVSKSSTTTSITFSLIYGDEYSYSLSTTATNWGSTNGTVNATTNNQVVPVTFGYLYSVTFLETTLPGGSVWSVNLSGVQDHHTTSNTLTYDLLNGTYGYHAISGNTNYRGVTGTFSVNGASQNIPITFTEVTYFIDFKLSPTSVYSSTSTWFVNLSNGQDYFTSGAHSFGAQESNGTYSYRVSIQNTSLTAVNPTGTFTVNGSNLTVYITFTYVTYSVYYNETGLPTGTTWYVNINSGGWQFTSTSQYTVSLGNGSYTYQISSGNSSYQPVPNSGAFTVNGHSVGISVAFQPVQYSVTFTETGLPAGVTWFVNLTGVQSLSGTGPAISTLLTNGTYPFTIGSANRSYEASAGSITVNGASVSENVSFSVVNFPVTFFENGVPTGTTWYVNFSGLSYSSTGTSLLVQVTNGTYHYTAQSGNRSYSSPAGIFTMNGSGIDQYITFSLVTYSVSYIEAGLPSGVTWYMNVTGQTSVTGTGTTLIAQLPNGTYHYTVGTPDKTYAASAGVFYVQGSSTTVNIQFNPVKYSVTFLESGLPSGTVWYVNSTAFNSSAITGNSYTAYLTNGSYVYRIATADKTYKASGGTFIVAGGILTENATFSPVSYSVTFTESGLPSGTVWYVNSTAFNSSAITGNSYTAYLTNGSYVYRIATADKTYHASGSSFTVNGGTVSQNIVFSAVTYTVTFNETGLPSGTAWYVNSSTFNSSAITGNIFSIGLTNGSYVYRIATVDKIFRANGGLFNISGSGITIPVTFNYVIYKVNFTESGLPPGTLWYVNMSATMSSTRASYLLFGDDNGTYSYTASVEGRSYLSTGGTFTVSGSDLNITVVFTAVTYNVTFTESGLPTGTEWFVNVSGGQSFSSTGTQILIPEMNGSYAYTIGSSNRIYSASGGTFTVNGAPLSVPVAFNAVYYMISFTESGLPSGTTWYVNITGGLNYANNGPMIQFSLTNGTYVYRIATIDKTYEATGGTLTVDGNSMIVAVAFTEVTYAVNFTESGLPSGTTWYVNITGQPSLSTNGAWILEYLVNGSYIYSISTVDKTFHASGSVFTVNGANVTQNVTFNPVLYNATALETGLPAGTVWYVNSTAFAFISGPLTGNSYTVGLVNGTYAFIVSTVDKIYHYGKGTLTVNGSAVSVSIVFTPVQYSVKFISSGLPAGNLWYVNITGHTPLSTSGSSMSTLIVNGTYVYTTQTADKIYRAPDGILAVTGANMTVYIAFHKVLYNTTFTETNLPSGTTWYVNITGQTSYSGSQNSIVIQLSNGSYTYGIGTPDKRYHASAGSFSVAGSGSSVTVTFTELTYEVFFSETGLPSGTVWYVNLSGNQSISGNGISLAAYLPNGTYTYTFGSVNKVYASPGGSFTLHGIPYTINVVFSLVTYTVTFTETGLPSGTVWYVNLSNGTSYSNTGATIQFQAVNGSYVYAIATMDKTYHATGSSFLVNGGSVSRNVAFTEVTYAVNFTESGLPSGTVWYINISNGPSYHTNLSLISILLPNGTYTYTVQTVNKIYNASGGALSVNGASVNQLAAFSLVYYTVTFTETGLPSGTAWYVNLSNGTSYSNTGATIQFQLTNGTYVYRVATVDKTYHASGSSFTVNGAPVPYTVSFKQVTYTVNFDESGLPAGTTWYVNSTAFNSGALNVSVYSVQLVNGTYRYTAGTSDKIFMALPGSFTVNGNTLTENVLFAPVEYTANFTESGLPSGTTWYVNITGQPSLSTNGTYITVMLTNGTYAYTIQTTDKEYHAHGGSFIVSGSNLNQTVGFNPVKYTVYFTETGLPNGARWNASTPGFTTTFANAPQGISYMLMNGTYSFRAGTSDKTYEIQGSAMFSVTVDGGNISVHVKFVMVTYKVTFTETGLPAGTSWTVTLNGHSETSNAAAIIFDVSNSTYSWSVGNLTAYYMTGSSTGTITVNGQQTTVNVGFAAYAYINGTVSPGNATVYINGTRIVTHNGAFSVKEKKGTYEIKVTDNGYITYYDNVTVQPGVTKNLTANLSPVSSSPSSIIPGLTVVESYIVFGVISLLIIIGIVAAVVRRKKKEE